jgi:hypothetical protein
VAHDDRGGLAEGKDRLHLTAQEAVRVGVDQVAVDGTW